MSTVREEAKRLLDNLPDEASWDDVMYEMYVCKNIDEGLSAANAGKLVLHKDVKKRFARK